MYKSHEEEKKQGYLPRVLQVEKGTFTPTVFSTSGGMGKEADRLLRRKAERMSIKRGETYSSVMIFLRTLGEGSASTHEDLRNRNGGGVQEANNHGSEDRYPRLIP